MGLVDWVFFSPLPWLKLFLASLLLYSLLTSVFFVSLYWDVSVSDRLYVSYCEISFRCF